MSESVSKPMIRASSRYWTPKKLIIVTLGLFTFALGSVRGASIPFWADELSTAHIAAVPSWSAMVRLNQQMDLNPPFEPTLVWLSMHALGQHEFAGRLPSIGSFAIVVLCVFLLLARRVPLWFATAGSLLTLYNAEISYYATEARPYALELAMLGLALVAYDSFVSNGRKQRTAQIALFFALSGLLLTHLFGVFAVAAFLIAELVHTLSKRQVDFPTASAIVLPLFSLVLYLNQVHAQSAMVYPVEFRPQLSAGLLLYNSFLLKPIAPFAFSALILLLMCRNYPATPFRRFCRISNEEWVLFLMLSATPVLLAIVMRFHSPLGGFFPRYVIAVTYPAVFFGVLFVAWRSNSSLLIGRVFCILALAGALFTYRDVPGQAMHLLARGLLSAPDEVRSTGGVNKIDAELPLVVNDPHAFIQADSRLAPSDTSRMIYVTDQNQAMKYAHANAAEQIDKAAEAFHLRSKVVPYGDFIQHNSRFLVIGEIDHVSDWFLKSMLDQGANLQFLGQYDFAGKHLPLWLVTVKRG